MKMMPTGKIELKVHDEKVIKNLKNLTSILEPGDIIVCKLRDEDWGLLHDTVLWLNRGSLYCHAMIYFGATNEGKPLILEERKPRGAKITTLYRHIGRPVEVYRINHPHYKEFSEAILRVGEIIADSEKSFFDYFSIPRMFFERIGLRIKYRPKKNQFYNCAEYVLVCLLRAKELLDENLSRIYERDILAKIILPSYKVFLPLYFPELEFCQKVWEGRVGC